VRICGRFRGGLHILVRVRCLLKSSPAVPVSDNITPTNAYRPGKSALDEFLPEVHVQCDHVDVYIDPRDVQLDSVIETSRMVAIEIPPPANPVADTSRVQWWPMFAAALVGIGVSLLAFGAWARFGQF
jgi:hypothetical protein